MARAASSASKSTTKTARKTTSRRASKASPKVAEFSKEQELDAYREMLLSAALKKRPASFTAWA
jgi:hypothetical protein